MQRGFEGGWLGPTFSKAVFFGNGLMAIAAGLLAHTLVETFAIGPVAPFDAAAVVMLIGGAIIVTTWTENYGDNSEKRSFVAQCTKAAQAIARGQSMPQAHILLACFAVQILLLGLGRCMTCLAKADACSVIMHVSPGPLICCLLDGVRQKPWGLQSQS